MMQVRSYNKGKDAKPTETIMHIQSCLQKNGIQCEHEMMPLSVENCYSARVSVSGALNNIIAANGKGTTEIYCLASGYAELMERIQNQIFLYQIQSDDEQSPYKKTVDKGTLLKYKTKNQLMEEKDSFLKRILERYGATITQDNENWSKEELVWMQICRLFPHWNKGEILTAPFYHVQSRTYKWLPLELIKSLNLSNGMAAGNKLEEALVQGYSEILERYVQRVIIENQITPPDIPKEIVSQFPYVQDTVKKIENSGPYHVIIKDCSLDRGFPVVCGIICNKKTQTFGVRFGAHPNMEIALERVFTEALQGKRLEDFTRLSDLVFDKKREASQQNIFNTSKTGAGYYAAALFDTDFSYEFQPWNWDGRKNNKELAYLMTTQLEETGHNIYIQDVSFLGMPSVLIYVEEMSELYPCDTVYLKEQMLKKESSKILRENHNMNQAKARKLVKACELLRASVLENTIDSFYSIPLQGHYHGGNDAMGFLIAVCYFYLKDYQQSASYMASCLRKMKEDDEEYEYLVTAYKLTLSLSKNVPMRLTKNALKQLGNKNVVNRVLADFKSDNIFSALYPSCNDFHCDTCKYKNCKYPDIRLFYQKIHRAYCKSQSMTDHLHRLFMEHHVEEDIHKSVKVETSTGR